MRKNYSSGMNRQKDGTSREMSRQKDGASRDMNKQKSGASREMGRQKDGASREMGRQKDGATRDMNRQKDGTSRDMNKQRSGASRDMNRQKDSTFRDANKHKDSAFGDTKSYKDSKSRDTNKQRDAVSKESNKSRGGRGRFVDSTPQKGHSRKLDDTQDKLHDVPVDVFATFNSEINDADKLEGRNSVLEALKANRTINKLFVSKGEKEGSIRQILAMAKQKSIIVTEVERSALDSMSSTKAHQGVIAFVAVKDYVSVDDILLAAKERGEQPFIIILDEITDPHNLGSIMRTANSVGAHGIIIPKRRAIGLTSTVSKASAGAVEYVPVARVTNINQTIEYLKRNNVWVVGTDATGSRAFYNSDLKGATALVIGSEGTGMSKLVREKCDFVVNIPMQGEISSLNASVAAAIVMYEIKRQRDRSLNGNN